jgi:hypothetical protein
MNRQIRPNVSDQILDTEESIISFLVSLISLLKSFLIIEVFMLRWQILF